MFEARKYLYVSFACQQSLEKMLKAILVSNGKKVPITHNLTRLSEEAELSTEMENHDRDFLANLTPFAIEARYGDYRKNLSEIIDRKKAFKYLQKTNEVFVWLQKKLQ
jgi:HEPN domain-containing protein